MLNIIGNFISGIKTVASTVITAFTNWGTPSGKNWGSNSGKNWG